MRAFHRLRRRQREAAEVSAIRRRTLTIALFALLFLVAYGGWRYWPKGAGSPPARPSVLLIVVDCLRADHLGSYGYARPTSPNLDALAARSTRFVRAPAQATWTLPSVTTLMTGLYPPTHLAELPKVKPSEKLRFLAQRFQDAGYRTAGIVSTNYVGSFFGMNRGMDFFDESLSAKSDAAATSGEAIDKVLAYFDSVKGAPFFLFLHLFDPHVEYRPPPGYREFGTDDLSLYDGEIAYLDHELGRLFAEMERRELADRTIVVVTGDHGEEFYEHGINEHGTTLYQMALHVPLILHVPGRDPAVVPDVASLVDVAPTLLRLAGLPPDPDHQGRDLLAPLAPADPSDGLAGPRSYAQLLVDTSRWTPTVMNSVLARDWHYVEDRTKRTRELYHLPQDPREEHDAAARHADVRDRLQGEIDAWLAACRAKSAAMGIARGDEVTDPETLKRLRELGYIR